MTKKLVLAALLSLSLVGCADDKKSSETTTPITLTQKIATDTSRCHGNTPVDVNLFSRKWNSKIRYSNGAVVRRTFTFTRNQVEVLARGDFEGRTSEIQTSAKFRETGVDSFTWDSTTQVTSTLRTSTQLFTYGVQFNRANLIYSFAGPCLVIASGSESLILVPSF